jgi:hypothetical protein
MEDHIRAAEQPSAQKCERASSHVVPAVRHERKKCADCEGKIAEATANHRRDCISEAIRLLDELCLLGVPTLAASRQSASRSCLN